MVMVVGTKEVHAQQNERKRICIIIRTLLGQAFTE